jgi:hypothetical protein
MTDPVKVVGLNDKKKEFEENEEIVLVKTKFGVFIGIGIYDEKADTLLEIENAYELAATNAERCGFIFVIVGDITELGEDVVVIEVNKKSIYYEQYVKAKSGLLIGSNAVPPIGK